MKMMRKLLYAGAWAGLMVMSVAPASAEVRNLGVIGVGQEAGAVIAHSKLAGDPAVSFMDQILFDIAQPGPDGAVAYFNFKVVNSNGVTTSNISNAFLNLTGPSAYSFALVNGMRTTLALAAGSYAANITGSADGRDGGSYNFLITAPTPEPEIWLSMAVGLGMAGFMARRRKQQATA